MPIRNSLNVLLLIITTGNQNNQTKLKVKLRVSKFGVAQAAAITDVYTVNTLLYNK